MNMNYLSNIVLDTGILSEKKSHSIFQDNIETHLETQAILELVL